MCGDRRKLHTDMLTFGYINDMRTYIPGPDGKLVMEESAYPKYINAIAKMTESIPPGTLLKHLH